MEYSVMFSEIEEITRKQFAQCQTLLGLDFNVQVYSERTFIGLEDGLDDNSIYVILHFEQGTIMLGGTIQPIVIEMVSEPNSKDIAQKLLETYGLTFNYNIPQVESGAFVQQVYTTPIVEDNYTEDGHWFRTTLVSNGTIVYGENISGISEIEVSFDEVENEKVLFTSVNPTLQISPNSANLGNNYSRTTTTNRFGTFTISFNMVSQQTKFVELCDQILFGTKNINTTIGFAFVKNNVRYTKNLKFINVELAQEQGGIPTYTVGLTE